MKDPAGDDAGAPGGATAADPVAPDKRARWRDMGLATLSGGPAQGFFIPYRYAHALPAPPNYPAIASLFARAEADFAAVLAQIASHAADFARFGGPAPAPRWDQSWFPGLDAAAAYAITRARAPARVIEVGSGHSTRVLARAISDGGLSTRILAIDPAPRAAIEGLKGVDIRRATLQQIDESAFDALQAGDALFIDSSHIAMPGADVDVLFNRILPRLPAGALIHVHDIFLPDPYPASWEWRGYNEQMLAAVLMTAGGARPLFASHWAATRMTPRARAALGPNRTPPAGAVETSLWLEKTTPAIR